MHLVNNVVLYLVNSIASNFPLFLLQLSINFAFHFPLNFSKEIFSNTIAECAHPAIMIQLLFQSFLPQ